MNTRVRAGVVVLVVAAAAVGYALDGGEGVLATVCYLGVLVGASVAAWIGAERAPPGRRLVPRLIAGGVSLTALGDVTFWILGQLGAGTDVSIADLAWFASYVVLCAALWAVINQSRGRRGGRFDVDYVIDAGTIVVVTVLIFWSFSVRGILIDDSLTPWVRTVWAAYPIADAVLLALVVRALTMRNARQVIGVSFTVGVCMWLAADIAYLTTPALGGPVAVMANLGWMLAPVLMARAAWRVVDRRGAAPDATVVGSPAFQVFIAIGPLLVPTALVVVGDMRGQAENHDQLVIGTVVLIGLAFVRTLLLNRSEAHAQAEAERSRDAALEAARVKSLFLANVSHEFRTPLASVLASGEILEDTPLNDLQVTLLGRMQRSGERLKTLVEGLLDFSAIEAGQLRLSAAPFDLHALVAEAADIYEPHAIQVGIRFEWYVDPRVPQVVVGDPDRLMQILTNLLGNALKFTPSGSVRLGALLSTGHEDRRGALDVVEFVVSDTGIGILAEDQGSVFESFTQVDDSVTRHYGGTGLGLAICKELTQTMGGSITVQSEIGAGTTFVVRIPFVSPVMDHEVPGSLPTPTVARSGGPSRPAREPAERENRVRGRDAES